MFCPICGKENPEGSTFCAGCGKPIAGQAAPAAAPVAAPVAPQPAPQAQPQQQYAAPQQQYAQPQYAAPQAPVAPAAPAKPSPILPFGQFFKSLLTAAFKPVTGAADEAKKYDHIGNSLILSAIVVGILTIANFLLYMLRTTLYQSWPRNFGDAFVRVLRNFFGSFFDYALMTFGCAAVVLVIGMIFKEKWSFPRLLAIAAMATAPAFIVSDFLGSFVGLIPYVGFGSLFTIAAYAYYLLMLYEGMGAETKLTGNKKGFVLVICVALTGFVAHYF